MSIKINKQLNRPDGGVVDAGSIVDFNQSTHSNGDDTGTVFFAVSLYISEEAIEEGKKAVPSIVEFGWQLPKECDVAEWSELLMGENQTAILMHDWLKEIIDSKIGEGFTEII